MVHFKPGKLLQLTSDSCNYVVTVMILAYLHTWNNYDIVLDMNSRDLLP